MARFKGTPRHLADACQSDQEGAVIRDGKRRRVAGPVGDFAELENLTSRKDIHVWLFECAALERSHDIGDDRSPMEVFLARVTQSVERLLGGKQPLAIATPRQATNVLTGNRLDRFQLRR